MTHTLRCFFPCSIKTTSSKQLLWHLNTKECRRQYMTQRTFSIKTIKDYGCHNSNRITSNQIFFFLRGENFKYSIWERNLRAEYNTNKQLIPQLSSSQVCNASRPHEEKIGFPTKVSFVLLRILFASSTTFFLIYDFFLSVEWKNVSSSLHIIQN